jgi:hypothetical protein
MVNINIPAPKIGTIFTGPPKNNGDFLEKSSNNFDKISVICGDQLPE